jgi:hypothetical protein
MADDFFDDESWAGTPGHVLHDALASRRHARLTREQPLLWRDPGTRRTLLRLPFGRVPVPPAAAERERTTPVEESWIEILLIDPKGRPVPAQPYKIELPDGSFRSGRLDRNGRARAYGIPRGRCRVTFPDLDRRDWKLA